MADGDGRFPAVSGTPRAGSFLGGTPEAIFTKCFYQVRAWQIRVTADLVFSRSTGDDTVVFPSGATCVIVEAGSHDTELTGAYVDEDAIWQEFRPSQNEAQNGVAALYALLEFREPLYYTLDGDVDGEGRFDSRVRFADATGDIVGVLGSHENGPSGASGDLTVGTGLQVEVELDGDVIAAVPLFMNDGILGDLPDAMWTCAGRIIVEPVPIAGFWPWPVNGTDTFDVDTGEEITPGGHLLPDTNGHPRAFVATNEIP